MKTPFERYYHRVRDQRLSIEPVELFDALSKTNFRGDWMFKVVFDDFPDGIGSKSFDNPDDLIGYVFDKITTTLNKIIQVYYNKERSLVSMFMVKTNTTSK